MGWGVGEMGVGRNVGRERWCVCVGGVGGRRV